MITEVRYLNETERILRESVERVTGGLERRRVVNSVFLFVDFMERVQRMPVVARLAYFEAAYAVFDLLRRNRQLGRRVGMFDDSVKIIITQLLSKLLVENGADED